MRSTISFAGKPRSSSIRIFLILEYAPNREVYKQLTKAKGLGDKRAATYIYQMCLEQGDPQEYRAGEPTAGLQRGAHDGRLRLVRAPCSRGLTICGTLDYLPYPL